MKLAPFILEVAPLNSEVAPLNTNCRVKRAIALPPTLEIALLILEVAALTLIISLLNSKFPPWNTNFSFFVLYFSYSLL
ncbi:hypothetical protein [Nostoc sp.]|uniref:hypothetical protein n=1 Tax=Nostoc sp. TaxID=1180 RepID=UPI002FF49C5B